MEKAKTKRYILNALIMAGVLAFVVFYLCRNGIITPSSLKSIPVYAFVLLSLYYVAIFLLIAFIEKQIYSTFCPFFTFAVSIKNTFCGNLGSAITPLKSGHFPLKAYAQHKSGISFSDTAVGCVKCQIVQSATSVVVYAVVTVVLAITGSEITLNGIQVRLFFVSLIGFGVNTVVLTLLLIVVFNSKIQNAVLKACSAVLKKFKRIDDRDTFEKSKREKLELYKSQIIIVGKSMPRFIIPAVLYGAFMILRGSGQYIAYMLISKTPFSFGGLFTFYIFDLTTAYMTNLIPLPSGVGSVEIFFTMTFSLIIPEQLLGAVLVLYRACSAYIIILFDLIVFAITSLKGKHRATIRNTE